jgi:hypothetical protein
MQSYQSPWSLPADGPGYYGRDAQNAFREMNRERRWGPFGGAKNEGMVAPEAPGRGQPYGSYSDAAADTSIADRNRRQQQMQNELWASMSPREQWDLQRKREIEDYAARNPGFARNLKGMQEQKMLNWILSAMGGYGGGSQGAGGMRQR